ncbi:CBS domain-containing protein [bacterium]|nr:CBS domain-containing protein [bacterium]
MPHYLRLILRGFDPVVPLARPARSLRAALGAVAGLLVAQSVLWALARIGGAPDAGLMTHPLLIAPFGASAAFVFALPENPMAQPWSVVAGNALSALVAIAVLHLGLPAVPALVLAVSMALVVMDLARAPHPPGAAVAAAAVLASASGAMPGPAYLVVTVALGSLVLTGCGMVYHSALRQAYPFRPAPPVPLPEPAALPPSPLILARALDRLSSGTASGPDGLAELSRIAEAVAAGLGEDISAGALMSAPPVTVGPAADWRVLAAQFVDHGFRALPVVDGQNRYLGLIPVQAVLRPGAQGLSARHLLQETATCLPEARLPEIVPALAAGGQTVLPVVDAQGGLIGVLTRSDLVTALVRCAATDQAA